MSLFSLLLRVLLCVSLIANGVGFAQASTRMQLAHAGHQAHRAQAEVASTVGEECHPGMTMASHADTSMPPMDHAAMDHGDSDTGPLVAVSDGGSAEPADCCDGTTCQCACTQHASTAFIPAVAPGAALPDSILVMVGTSQHASPRLPHLIRPPIG